MRNILLAFVLILALMGSAMAVGTSGVEMKPGEAAAERMFEKGYGEPWVGGNPPWQQDGYDGYGQHKQLKKTLILPYKKSIASGLQYYLLGTVYDDGYLTIGYGPGSLRIPYPAGTYRVFGCYDKNERLVGVYIDLGGYYNADY